MLKILRNRFFLGAFALLWAVALTATGDTAGEAKTDGDASLSVIRHRDGRLSVKARNVSLKRVFREIEKQTKVKIVFKTSADTTVSTELSHLQVETVLKRLTHGFGRAFFYQPDRIHTGSMTIKKVVLYGNLGGDPATGKRYNRPRASGMQDDVDRESLNKVRELLTSEDPDARLEAVHMLTESEDAGAVDYLAELLYTDRNEIVRDEAAEALALMDGDSGLEVLKTALEEEDASVRLSAIEALGNFGDEKTAMELVPYLEDSHPDIRIAVISLLSDIGGEEAAELVSRALNDQNAEVREAARFTLADIKEMNDDDIAEDIQDQDGETSDDDDAGDEDGQDEGQGEDGQIVP